MTNGNGVRASSITTQPKITPMDNVPNEPGAGAEALIQRNREVLDQVHQYALETLSHLEEKISALKIQVENSKNEAQIQTQHYIELVHDTLNAAKAIDTAVDRVAEQLNGK